MPKYRVKIAAGLDFPVGYEFETENLHPVMRQHVEVVGGSSAQVEDKTDTDKEDKALTEAQLNKLHEAALKEDAKRFPKAPPEKVVKPANGPGENS